MDFQCYWDELMILKCQIKINTNENGFSVLLRWANDIKMPDQNKYEWKWIYVSYNMFRRGIEIFILSFNYSTKNIHVCEFYKHIKLIVMK